MIYRRFTEDLAKRKQTPIAFPDVDSIRRWFDDYQQRLLQSRVDRGLFVRMTDEEVAAARRRLESGQPAAGAGASRGRRWKVLWWPALVTGAALLFIAMHPRPHRGGDRTIEYRGRQFKLSKAYAEYDDYKDDPNNLDTNELPRIEQTMRDATIPTNFATSEEFIKATSDLDFPGYGQSVISGGREADGSSLELVTTEIPQRDKDRCVLAREMEGAVTIVDDFVISTATNEISKVTLQGGTLQYYDNKGTLVREKKL